ncbi:hypothetical protein DSM112329_02802 [Paraconexibacter sp. AEG42_29]|uniref:Uncharacterized protein n=1 Tax=Paraconexibacter sp. AEG42_29 TaxID=2997339 RepID=A0AAU7AW39_9ACTN
MTEARQAAIVAELVRQLRDHGSWAGETHVQKTAYFLQEMLDVPLGFEFQLYKFGPFAFQLRDLLGQMRSLRQLRLEPQPAPYGPKLTLDDGAPQLRTRFPKTVRTYDPHVSFVAEEIGKYGVGTLERLATALMVKLELPDGDASARAALLHSYKPHVSVTDALDALSQVDAIRDKARAASII